MNIDRRTLPWSAPRRRMLAGLAALAGGAADLASGQEFPARPLRFVMPFAAGGGSDLVARVIAEFLGKRLGQPVVVDNVTGAGGTIGAKAVVSATPDGYTLLFTPQSPLTIAGLLDQKPAYDPDRDLLPLAMVATTPALVAVHPSLGVASLKELAALTSAAPDKYFYGSPGEAHEYQLTAALLLKATGGRMTHVAYRGVAPVVADLVAGQVQMAVLPIQVVRGFAAEGKLKVLAVVGSQRLTGFGENVPTTVESGVSDVTVYGWFGVFAPARLSPATAARLRNELLALPKDPAYAKKMAELGFDPVAMPTAEFARTIQEHRLQWKSVIRMSGESAQAR
jgi:tripartite-type tricarboxylate transporter receptor subunit TctC